MSRIEAQDLISIFKGIEEIYNKDVKDLENLPQSFSKVANRLPLVRDILQTVGEPPDEQARLATQGIMETCNFNAVRLRKLFKIVAAWEDEFVHEDYLAAIKRLSNGKPVETVAREMMEDVRRLALNDEVKAATEPKVAELLTAIEELSDIEPSLQSQGSVNQNHSGSGDNVAGNKVMGNHNQNDGTGTAYFGNYTQKLPKQT